MLKPPAVLPTSAEVSILAVAWVGMPNNKTNKVGKVIDGQRLIATAGTNGQANSEYHTEIESFRKIKFTGNHWTVKTKSGQTFEYGNTDDSKYNSYSSASIWALISSNRSCWI
jgi:phosphatidate phosphatase APP1